MPICPFYVSALAVYFECPSSLSNTPVPYVSYTFSCKKPFSFGCACIESKQSRNTRAVVAGVMVMSIRNGLSFLHYPAVVQTAAADLLVWVCGGEHDIAVGYAAARTCMECRQGNITENLDNFTPAARPYAKARLLSNFAMWPSR